MLPFGLKLAWFALSLSGLIGCWAVLLPLAWAIKSYWGPIAYAVGITALEGYLKGLVWRMNTASLPRGFCVAQVLITGLAAFFLIGVLAAITTATAFYVAKPKQWGQDNNAVLPWLYYYLLPMLLFPLLASAVQVTFVVFFDTFDRTDGLNCVAHPLWIQFLGYAGTPFLITVPCFWLSLVSVFRVIRTHKHIRRARRSVNFEALDHFTIRPQRRKSQPALKTRTTPLTPVAITAPSPSPSSILRTSREERRQAISPVLRQEKITSFHLPFPPPSPEYMMASSGHRYQNSEDSFDTISSVSFAETDVKNKAAQTFEYTTEEDDVRTPLRSYVTPAGTTRSTRSIHSSDRISNTQLAFALGNIGSSESSDYVTETPPVSGLTIVPSQTEHRTPAELPSIIRSLLIFQFAIIAIHLLSTITPVIDIVSSRPELTALGTQHVALLLAGWVPVAIFGPLSAVRCQFIFWR
ncbi:hypothetical protein FB451DRAFT_1400701 [Mycena latifolia]|nr:hypothetical protein FB451DRAFT_1400701 [Mycena latifolia]